MSLHRREFLATSTLAGLTALTPRSIARPVRPPGSRSRPSQPGTARNVIFMVSDGMSTGTLTLAQMARLQREGRPSHWVSLWNRPGVRRATATTFAADSLVTDSAAGSTAWSIGQPVNNGAISIMPDGRAPVPILPHAAQSGKATGLVTTTRITHATPAGFIANVPVREMEGEIARQMLGRAVDVALGGGARFFPEALLRDHGRYTVVRTAAELDAAPAQGRLLGLFSDSHMPFELDRPATLPTLRRMTRAALERLAPAPEGFILQVEGGRIDHAAHSNDAGALLADQLAFDDAIEEVLAFADGRDDTLVIITTDHGNANPGFTHYRERGTAAFEALLAVRGSFEAVEARFAPIPRDDPGALPALRQIIRDVIGVGLSDAEADLLRRALDRERVALFSASNHPMTVLGGLLTNHLGVGFASGNHTADAVEVTAFGPGSEHLSPFIANTDLHGLMVRALALPPARPIPGQAERVEPVRAGEDD